MPYIYLLLSAAALISAYLEFYPFIGYYTVLKGKHYSIPPYKSITFSNSRTYKITLNNAEYNHHNQDQFDFNKLIGLSYNSTDHHKDSFRLGHYWDPINNEHVLAAYIYKNGHRMMAKMLRLKQYEKTFYLKWMVRHNKVTMMVYNSRTSASYAVTFDKDYSWGLTLQPYFGGNLPAPHNWSVQVKREL
jgi:hypothetical protein